MERVAGHLEIGTTGQGEVVVNHPKLEVDAAGAGHIVFSPKQARALAETLNQKADAADQEKLSPLDDGKVTNEQIARLIQADYWVFSSSGTLTKDGALEAITTLLDTYRSKRSRQENIDAMRDALQPLGQSGRVVGDFIDAVLHEPYLKTIERLRSQIKKLTER